MVSPPGTHPTTHLPPAHHRRWVAAVVVCVVVAVLSFTTAWFLAPPEGGAPCAEAPAVSGPSAAQVDGPLVAGLGGSGAPSPCR